MTRTSIGAIAVVLMAGGVLFATLATSKRPVSQVGSVQMVDDSPAAAKSEWLKEFTLTDQTGKKFHSKDLAGQVHIVNFFFAKCPTSCRTQTAAVRGVVHDYASKGVKFLSITCDPENDTPAALSIYSKEFGADPQRWVFLTGDLTYLQRVGAEMYSLHVDVGTHSESLVVVDKWGQIRGRFSWKDATELGAMKKLLDELLAETEAPKVKPAA